MTQANKIIITKHKQISDVLNAYPEFKKWKEENISHQVKVRGFMNIEEVKKAYPEIEHAIVLKESMSNKNGVNFESNSRKLRFK